ncbi:MAG: hypothetical protein WKF79_02370 [Nocardioides sp.]
MAAGVGGFTSATRFHGSAAAGTFLYHESTAALRRLVVPQGWGYDEEDQQPRTFSVERGLTIVVQTGDENTGLLEPEAEPRPRHPKGVATARKVASNSEQLALFAVPQAAATEDDQEQGDTLTWVLLVAVGIEVARAELSLPRQMSEDGRPCGWVHRILLPEIAIGGPINDSPSKDGHSETDVDVDVEWKQ